MTNIFTAKTNFTAGELSSDLLGRVDLRSYENGAMELKNVFIEATGGIKRRPGLKYVDTLDDCGRLLCLEYSALEPYLIVLQDHKALIYDKGVLIKTLETPYRSEQIKNIRWCQSNDKLLLTHQDIAPKQIFKGDNGWTLSDFTFMVEDGCLLQPYHKFCDAGMTIKSSAVTGNVTLTTSGDFFEIRHVGQQLKIADGYAEITAIKSTTTAEATIKKKLVTDAEEKSALEPTRSFLEPAFNETFGWPSCIAFYQSRLVFGGSRRLPNTLWFSQSNDITNFEMGDGYDAQAIEFTIMSDVSNAIQALYAGRHLQVFTTSSEWMVSGDPLTPENIQLNRQTQVGSIADRYVPPFSIDGATIFAGANNHEIREFLFADIEQAYQATELSLLASHLIDTPIDCAYDKHRRQAYIVMNNGRLSVLCSLRSENLQSWTEQITDGHFISVCMAGDNAYFITQRSGHYYLECFDDTLNTDCAVRMSLPENTSEIKTPNHLKNKQITIMLDDIVLPDIENASDKINITIPAKTAEIGLAYTHIISPLPPAIGANNAPAPVSSYRLIKACFRIINTNTLEIDTGNGIKQEMPYALGSYMLNSANPKETVDVVVRALGWIRNPTTPSWRIVGSLPKHFKLVSVTQHLKIGG